MKHDIKYFIDRVNTNPVKFCEHFLSGGRREGNYWICGDKTGIPGRSMAVHLTGQYVGKWFDNATGESGNFLDILYFRYGKKTLAEFSALLSLPIDTVATPIKKIDCNSSNDGFKRLYTHAINNDKTRLARYLASRSIYSVPDCLRYNANTYVKSDGKLLRLPALLAPITNNNFQLIGVSKTFLDYYDDKKANIFANKRISGTLKNGAVRFYSPNDDVTNLIVGEGIETILSVRSALPNISVAACLSAINLANFIPPPSTRRLWVAFDNDDAGHSAFTKLLAKAEHYNFNVIPLAAVNNDHNDDLICCKNFAKRLNDLFYQHKD